LTVASLGAALRFTNMIEGIIMSGNTTTVSKEKIDQLAQRLRDAEASGNAIEPLRDELPAGDATVAYQVQHANVEYWRARGRRVVGRKIGLTAKAVQRQLGVDQPDFRDLSPT